MIVNVCSVGATHQTAGAAYCASKGAVLAATKNTAFMYMEEGIRCNALSPGGVVTDIPLVMPPADEFGFGRTSKLLDFSGELAMPEDLADAILFLASDQSRYVNGRNEERLNETLLQMNGEKNQKAVADLSNLGNVSSMVCLL